MIGPMGIIGRYHVIGCLVPKLFNLDGVTKKFGLRIENQVYEYFDTCKIFPQFHFQSGLSGNIGSIEADGMQAFLFRKVNGPLIVEFLGNHRHLVQAKHLFGAHHGIKGPKPGVVQKNPVFRDAPLYEVLFYGRRLIVVNGAIIAAYQNKVDLAGFEKGYGGVDAIGIVGVRLSVCTSFGSAQYQTHPIFRNAFDSGKCLSLGRTVDGVVTYDKGQ